MKVPYRHVLPTHWPWSLYGFMGVWVNVMFRFMSWIIRKESTCCCGSWTRSYFTYVKMNKYTQRQLFHAAFALGVSLDLFLSLSFPLQSHGCCGGCGWFFFIFSINGRFRFIFPTSKLQSLTYIFKIYFLDDFVMNELWRPVLSRFFVWCFLTGC